MKDFDYKYINFSSIPPNNITISKLFNICAHLQENVQFYIVFIRIWQDIR